MATSRKVLREEIKKQFIDKINNFFTNDDEEVLIVGSNKLAIPVVDREGNEDFIVITISIPTGSRADNDEAESYRMKVESNKIKAEEKAKKKAEKIKKDAEFRRKQKENKEKGKA